MNELISLIQVIRSLFQVRSRLIMENLALRQQLAVMMRSVKRPRIRMRYRVFWVAVCRLWSGWRESLVIVRPKTVVQWHKRGFKAFWRWKSRAFTKGRPGIAPEIRDLVRKMAQSNPLWGAPRIHGELMKLGFSICQRTVSSLMPKRPQKPPSQTWRTFIKNHMHSMCSMDFLTVPSVTFKVLFVLVTLSHDRRRVLHFNVTANPTASWTAQQMLEAFPWDTAPKYLIRDRDSIYGAAFRKRVKDMGIEEVLIAPRSPWQNPYVERVIGSIRRECLDHLIVLNERHLMRILRDYFKYYHRDRTHLSLKKDTPHKRPINIRPPNGKIVALPKVGGLHHRYVWKKAA